MTPASPIQRHWLRALLVPEVALAILNACILAYLFIDQIRGVEVLYDVYRSATQLLPVTIDRSLTEIVFGFLLAPVMLPVTFFVIMPMVYLNVARSDWGMVLVLGSILPNAILWGEFTMYFYRLIRTGSHREARSQMFTWWRRGKPQRQHD